MRIVVTGADGFIGRNLTLRLAEAGYEDIHAVTRQTSDQELLDLTRTADFVYHLAGVNRPKDPTEFTEANAEFTERLCELLAASGGRAGIAFSSSTQAELPNPYGESKRCGEEAVLSYGRSSGSPSFVLRFPNVFGKWSRPNYNSAIATFCHNLARGLPIRVNDPAAPLTLLYVDDAVTALIGLLRGDTSPGFVSAEPTYSVTVGEVVSILESFTRNRTTLLVPSVGRGLTRALFATYQSFCPPEAFTYPLKAYTDPRGSFVEILKSADSGQFSYFTAFPGITRGGHYHHTKSEKFLIVQGEALFGFRNLLTGDRVEVRVSAESPSIVETVPGWAHDVTNVGSSEMIALVWANEVFDPAAPDTIPASVSSPDA